MLISTLPAQLPDPSLRERILPSYSPLSHLSHLAVIQPASLRHQTHPLSHTVMTLSPLLGILLWMGKERFFRDGEFQCPILPPPPCSMTTSAISKDSNVTPSGAVWENDSDEDDEGSSMAIKKTPSPRGQYNNTDRETIDEAFEKINQLFTATSKRVGRPFTTLVDRWNSQHRYPTGTSAWNQYQVYFAANTEKERKRMGDPDANCKYFCFAANLCLLTVMFKGRTCWVAFKVKYKENVLDFLETQIELLKTAQAQTLAQHCHEFKKFWLKMEKTALEGSGNGFETIFVTVRNCVNEDTSLAKVWCSSGVEGVGTFVQQSLSTG